MIVLTQKEILILCSYIYNNRCRYEREVQQRQTNIRYREIDVVDCIELACSIERLNTFKEVTKDIRALLKLCERNDDNENTMCL